MNDAELSFKRQVKKDYIARLVSEVISNKTLDGSFSNDEYTKLVASIRSNALLALSKVDTETMDEIDKPVVLEAN